MVPLNDTEIVILGGQPDFTHDANLGDVVVFDSRTEKFKQVVSGTDQIVHVVVKKKPVKKEEKKQSITKKKTKVGFGGGVSVQVKKVEIKKVVEEVKQAEPKIKKAYKFATRFGN